MLPNHSPFSLALCPCRGQRDSCTHSPKSNKLCIARSSSSGAGAPPGRQVEHHPPESLSGWGGVSSIQRSLGEP
jgi:hypothetical protein